MYEAKPHIGKDPDRNANKMTRQFCTANLLLPGCEIWQRLWAHMTPVFV